MGEQTPLHTAAKNGNIFLQKFRENTCCKQISIQFFLLLFIKNFVKKTFLNHAGALGEQTPLHDAAKNGAFSRNFLNVQNILFCCACSTVGQ